MKMRCGHREADVERGWCFAWRKCESPAFRLVVAAAISAGFVGMLLASTRITVSRSMARDGERLPAVTLVTSESLRGSALERFVEIRSPLGAQEAGLDSLPGITEWLGNLGLVDERNWRPHLAPAPRPALDAEKPMIDRKLSLPEVPGVEFGVPRMSPEVVVRLSGIGRLEDRVSTRELSWQGSLPSERSLVFWAVIDERGKLEIALPDARDAGEEDVEARRLLERQNFGPGARRSGRLKIEFGSAGQ